MSTGFLFKSSHFTAKFKERFRTPRVYSTKPTVISKLENVEIPKPDDYTLYIVLDGLVRHKILLTFI